MRTPNDCLRAAVSAAYEIPVAEMPAPPAGSPTRVRGTLSDHGWAEWALARGLRWCWSWDVAPISLPRWLATVDALDTRGGKAPTPTREAMHCVAMEGRRLFYEPSAEEGEAVYRAILPSDIRAAYWLEPVDSAGQFKGKVWRISNREITPHYAPGVHRQEVAA